MTHTTCYPALPTHERSHSLIPSSPADVSFSEWAEHVLTPCDLVQEGHVLLRGGSLPPPRGSGED